MQNKLFGELAEELFCFGIAVRADSLIRTFGFDDGSPNRSFRQSFTVVH